MPVRHEIKSQLAKLLATEDLVVEHKKVETACFDVHRRVLTLPMWEKASGVVYDLLVGHEVGHALETPDEDWTENYKIPPQFVNIVEDARVEKLMKRRYPGLSKTFYRGYKELSDDDFFCIGDDDVDEYNLADRANLYFKVGSFSIFKFNDEEQKIIDKIASAETFQDVLIVSQELYNYCKQQDNDKEKIDVSINPLQNNSGGGSSMSSDSIPTESSSDEIDDSEDEKNKKEESNNSHQSNVPSNNENEPQVKTANSFEESIKNLVSNDTFENVYVEIPKLNLGGIIIQNSKIHEEISNYWNYFLEENNFSYNQVFYEVDEDYNKFKNSAQTEVNYLVKEFERRKSADAYARASTSRTGVLDCSKLHTYKYNEDIFKKIVTIPDGKNHGLIFILDWSGSMSKVMLDTIKQLFNLIWFCRKVSIPFEVYAFTTEYPRFEYNEHGSGKMRQPAYEKFNGCIEISEYFSLLNLFNSKVSSKVLEEQLINVYRMATYYTRSTTMYDIPKSFSLSGTPLNETVITLNEIIPAFKKYHKVEKIQCVILTDGEGCNMRYHKEVKHRWNDQTYLGVNSVGASTFLRDRKTGNTYYLGGNWHICTDVLLKNLKDRFNDVNFIGIRVLENRDANHFIRRYYDDDIQQYDKICNIWRKEKCFSITKSGYDIYFGMSGSDLSNEVSFEVSESATKSQIKSAFVKSLNAKKTNKKMLSKFIELVA